jgi:hypothetical protein
MQAPLDLRAAQPAHLPHQLLHRRFGLALRFRRLLTRFVLVLVMVFV